MKTTLFPEYTDKYFAPIARGITEKINDKSSPPVYLFKEFFTPRAEPTLKFESLTGLGSIVAADMVAMDSALPLKKRDALSKSSGDILKLGMKMQLRESDMTNIKLLRVSAQQEEILQILFSDVKKCIEGIYSRLEWMGLSAISSGVIALDDENNEGICHRIEFAIPSSNRFGANTKWEDPKAQPLDDIEKVIKAARARGDAPGYLLMDYDTFNRFKASPQVKARYAAHLNLQVGNSLIPSLERTNEFLMADYKVAIRVIDSCVRIERNGASRPVFPWSAGKVVFSSSLNFGSLAYGSVAEVDFPSKGATYEKVDNYILLSKFSREDPICEFTAAQARVVPVLNNTESLYQLNASDMKWS